MENILIIDGFEYVLENGAYVNKSENAYYEDMLDWGASDDHLGMRCIYQKIGARYLVKYIFTKEMESDKYILLLDELNAIDATYRGMHALEVGSDFIGGLFSAI